MFISMPFVVLLCPSQLILQEFVDLLSLFNDCICSFNFGLAPTFIGSVFRFDVVS